MKKTKLVCSTVMLMIAFSIPIFAGDQGTPARTAPGDQHGPARTEPGDQGTPARTAPGDQHGPARTVSGELSSQAWTGILLALDLVF